MKTSIHKTHILATIYASISAELFSPCAIPGIERNRKVSFNESRICCTYMGEGVVDRIVIKSTVLWVPWTWQIARILVSIGNLCRICGHCQFWLTAAPLVWRTIVLTCSAWLYIIFRTKWLIQAKIIVLVDCMLHPLDRRFWFKICLFGDPNDTGAQAIL
jgi:hypothetical protein